MYTKSKFLLINLMVNFIIFLLLFIGIQNANTQNRVKFLKMKSIELPVGFILGLNFVIGSAIGSALVIIPRNDQN